MYEVLQMKFVLNDYHRNLTDDELLEDIKRVHSIVGNNSLSQVQYKQYGKYGLNTFRRRFGGWNNALMLCGIAPNVYQSAAAKSSHFHREVTDEELLLDIVRVSTILNKRTYSSHEYNEFGEYSSSTCFKHFGSWNNALELAGLEPYKQVSGKRIDTNKLFEEIERMWIALGRQPTSTDVKNGLSCYTLNTFTRRFGGWRQALEEFIQWIERDASEENDNLNENNVQADIKVKKPTIVENKTFPLCKHRTLRDINLRLRFRVMQRDNFKCCLCGASPASDPSVQLHIDHIIPWSRGGDTVIDNLQTLCSKCNLGKSNLPMDD